jgi:hypothetical protein
MLEDHFKQLEVATYTIVVGVASQFHSSRLILLFERVMAIFTTPCPYLFPTPT